MPERAGHGADRDATDAYPTTPELARLICDAVRRDAAPRPRAVLEPGCGTGSFLEAIRAVWPSADLHGVEVRPDLGEYAKARGFDVEVADVLRTRLGTYDLIIGNPPFRFADEFVPLLLGKLRPGGTLALILRLNYLAGQKRYGALWATNPPAHVYALPARPGFTPDGKTDATDYCVVVWTNGHRGPPTFGWLDNRETRNTWNADTYPDVRALPTPKRELVSPRLSLAEWDASITEEARQ